MDKNTKPTIGINVDLAPTGKNGPIFMRLHMGYVDSVVTAGGRPLLLPPLPKSEDVEAFLDGVDGLVMVGGADLDPKRSGQPSHPSVVPMAERREQFDKLLLQSALNRKMPILAIGVGMQLLNVLTGGTLFLHLPEECPKAFPHFDPTGSPHRHALVLEPKSRIDEIYGSGELRVNSCHHQGVKTIGPKMRVGAYSPDGVVEAIESTDANWFCMGVQWHPESETASALDMQLFEGFVQAAAKTTGKLRLAA